MPKPSRNRGFAAIVETVETVEKTDRPPSDRRIRAAGNPQLTFRQKHLIIVENVENSFSEQMFTDFNDISGPHGYQQITVGTFF